MTAVSGKGLKKTYAADGSVQNAVDGVDIDVEAGELVAVMGPSGSGKSTLLHLLGGLDMPDDGEVFLEGRPMSGLSRKELAVVRRRHIGFVFQFFNLIPVLSVAENITLPAAMDGMGSADTEERLGSLLDAFGIAALREKLPSQLSGGEQQRVAIARALINRPDVVLADEPTGNLDRTSGNDVMALLRRLNADGQTIVIVTHDPAVASFARRILFMRDGKLVDETRLEAPGEPSAILSKLVQLES